MRSNVDAVLSTMTLLVVLLFLLSSATAGSEAHFSRLNETLTSDTDREVCDLTTIAICKKTCATLESKAKHHTVYTEAVVSRVWPFLAFISLAAAVMAWKQMHQKQAEWTKRDHMLGKHLKGLGALAYNNAEIMMKLESKVKAGKSRECDLQMQLLQQQACVQQHCQKHHEMPASKESECQTDGGTIIIETALEGESSTPALGDLVSTAPLTKDAAACDMDQDMIRPPVSPKIAAYEPERDTLLHGTADAQAWMPQHVVHHFNAAWAEQGLQQRLVLQSTGRADSSLPLPDTSFTASSDTQSKQEHLRQESGLVLQPSDAAPDIVQAAGSNYATKDELKAFEARLMKDMLQKEVEKLQQQKVQLNCELSLLRSEQQSLLVANSAYVTTSRGTFTPLPLFARPMLSSSGGKQGMQSPYFSCTAPRSDGPSGNGGFSSPFLPRGAPADTSAHSSAGSIKQPLSGVQLLTVSSARSAGNYSRVTDAGPVPMQSLEDSALNLTPLSSARRNIADQLGFLREKMSTLQQKQEEATHIGPKTAAAGEDLPAATEASK
eukprot:gene10415-10573_t